MNQHTNSTPPEEEQVNKKKSKKNPLIFTVRLSFSLIISILTAMLVIGAILMVAYRDEINVDTLVQYLTAQQTDSEEDLATFVHAGGNDMDFAWIDSGIVMVSQTGGHYYSSSGERYDEAVSNLSIPVLTHSNNTAVIYDGGGQTLSLFSNRTLPFSLTLGDGEELLSARLNDSGWLAVTAQLSGYKGTVSIYDSSYNVVMEINRSSSFLVDGAISPDCKSVATVTIGQSAAIFQSSLLLYSVGGEDPFATVDLGDVVVLDMEFEEDCIWIVTDQALITLDQNGDNLQTYSYGQYHLKGYTLGGDGFAALLFSDYETGDPNRLVSVDTDCQSTGSRSLIGEVPDVDGSGSYVSVLTGDGLTVYTSNLAVYAQLEDSQGAQAVAQNSNGSVLLAGAQRAWIFQPDI